MTRKILRAKFGGIPVLYLNGAQGDVGINDLLHPLEESREEQLQRVGRQVADETLRLYQNVKYDDHPVLGHTYEDLKVKVRLPEPERLAEARKVLARIDGGENIRGQEMIMAFGAVHLQDWFGQNPTDTLPVHGVRIGDVALITEPCELYCQFGLDIKRRSPAPITAVVGLTDGYCGYCPTLYGILGGGYSGQAGDDAPHREPADQREDRLAEGVTPLGGEPPAFVAGRSGPLGAGMADQVAAPRHVDSSAGDRGGSPAALGQATQPEARAQVGDEREMVPGIR